MLKKQDMLEIKDKRAKVFLIAGLFSSLIIPNVFAPVLAFAVSAPVVTRPLACGTAGVDSSFGDANFDGIISPQDADLISDFLLGNTALTDAQKRNADTDGNQQLESLDVSYIRQYLNGQIDTFSACRGGLISPTPPAPPGGGGGGELTTSNVIISSSGIINESSLSKPLVVATLTSSPYFVYLSQVPYTGFGDSTNLILFLVLVALWSGVVVYVVKFVDIKKIIRRAFRNVEDESQFAEANMSGGFVYDVDNSRVLTMDMNPINNSSADIFVPKYGVGNSQADKINEAPDIYTPTARDHGIDNGNDVSNSDNGNHIYNEVAISNNNDSVKKNDKFDLTTDVNSFVNLIVRGDEKPVLEFIRKIKDKGVIASDFAANVVLELDNAYRAKMAGETNRRNIVLSQIVSHWSGTKIEAVMNGLFAIVENSYVDNNLGTKIALMRIMRS